MSSYDLNNDFESSLSLQSSTNSRSFDFDGLEESLVDESEDSYDDAFRRSDELNASSREQSFHRIRNALIRDSNQRTEDDLDAIQDFLEAIVRHKPRHSLQNKDFHTKRLLAKHMVLAEIEARDTRVLTDGERLDAYCIVACGSLRHVTPAVMTDSCVDCEDEVDCRQRHCVSTSACVRYLTIGDEFGAHLDDRIVFGEIFTNEDFVWVLCVPHVIFDEICGEKSFKTVFDEKNEKVIEIRNQYSNELLRASKERLLDLLLGERQIRTTDGDDTLETEFISDFLLTFRLFWYQKKSNNSDKTDKAVEELLQRVIANIKVERNVEKSLKVVLFWISNHFQDFRQKSFLDQLEASLKSKIHKKLFYFALSSKSRDRLVTITRSDRASELPFTLIGGYQSGTRLFIDQVNEECSEVRRGDRLLAINGVDCHVMEVSRAEQLCRASTHLSLHVQFDPHLFHMLLDGQITRNQTETKRHLSSCDISLPTASQTSFAALKPIPSLSSSSSLSSYSHNWRQKVLKIVQNVNKTHKNQNLINNNITVNGVSGQDSTGLPIETPEVIKIHFESDSRFLPIHATTTARECIQLALIEFQLNSNYSSRDFALFEYKLIDATNATSAVKRLSDNHQNLAHNLSLNSRLYLKCITGVKESGHPSDADITREIARECQTNTLLTLDALEIARELFERDFEAFCRIESQQFVYDLREESSDDDHRREELKAFEERTNQELFWTINRVLMDTNSMSKRVKCVKQLIKVALICRQLNNFNALFAIISGLSHQTIQRMKQLWEKIPQKSMNKLKKLYKLMDPSKNFSEFRSQLRHCEPPIIPFFPLVKKDLSFIDLANQTWVEMDDNSPKGKSFLVNWEKMRLLGHKCREVQHMKTRPATHTTEVDQRRRQTTTLTKEAFNQLKALNDTKESNYRRIWERQRMRKRVQHFLDNSFSELISDENLLLEKSMECEPNPDRQSSNTLQTSASSQRSSQPSSLSSTPAVVPSPTLSSHSSSPSLSSSTTNSSEVQSSSSQRLRFGVRDEFGLRKLLSLSDSTQPISHPTHPTIAVCPPPPPLLTHQNYISNRFSQNFCSKARLTEESSSVTSLRRMEQFQQMARFREQFMPVYPPPLPRGRPSLPSYDQTIQRMKKKLNKNEENIV